MNAKTLRTLAIIPPCIVMALMVIALVPVFLGVLIACCIDDWLAGRVEK